VYVLTVYPAHRRGPWRPTGDQGPRPCSREGARGGRQTDRQTDRQTMTDDWIGY